MQAHAEDKILLIADPKILAIPIVESHEKMIDLKDQKEIRFGPSPWISNNQDYTKVRLSVYKKLLEAQSKLPNNLKLCLFEGYRSLKLQEKFFNDRYIVLKATHPSWTHRKIFQTALKFVSPVINIDGSKNIPPHSTGGAIDLYLVDNQGNIVEMGIKVGDLVSDPDGSISQTNSIKISAEAQKNRQIMNKVLQEVGFINYPTEYWHWSYGDRYWAYNNKEKSAIYGSYNEKSN